MLHKTSSWYYHSQTLATVPVWIHDFKVFQKLNSTDTELDEVLTNIMGMEADIGIILVAFSGRVKLLHNMSQLFTYPQTKGIKKIMVVLNGMGATATVINIINSNKLLVEVALGKTPALSVFKNLKKVKD